MWAARPPVIALAALAALMSLLAAAGCGSSSSARSSSSTTQGASSRRAAPPAQTPGGGAGGTITLPTPAPTGQPASPAAVRVIRGWSDTLRHGDVQGAGRFFALPSRLINGPDANGAVTVLTIRSRAEAAAANAGLPCGATFVSADQRGSYVNALFGLGSRPGLGGDCQGASGRARARVNFVISGGLIVEWIRAPDEPGDNPQPGGGGQPPAGQPPTSAPAV